MRRFLFFLSLILLTVVMPLKGHTQIRVSGIVYDSSQLYVIPDVLVFTSSGEHSETDSLGSYHINALKTDSVYFFYEGKNSVKYAVNKIYDPSSFDISLRVTVKNKYKVLKGVTVFSKSYLLDSIENRERYEKIFDHPRATLETSVNDGVAGLDIGSLIQIFQFKKNKRRLAFHDRLIQQEQDAYVDYRFNSRLISRITGLTGQDLENYKKIYRPSYEFVTETSQVAFYTYILNTSYAFKNKSDVKSLRVKNYLFFHQ